MKRTLTFVSREAEVVQNRFPNELTYSERIVTNDPISHGVMGLLCGNTNEDPRWFTKEAHVVTVALAHKTQLEL